MFLQANWVISGLGDTVQYLDYDVSVRQQGHERGSKKRRERREQRDEAHHGKKHVQGRSGSCVLDKQQTLDRFLAGVEKKAFRIAEIATNDTEEAFDIVQDAMFKLVEKYARNDETEWGALFYRILHSRINDWYRRTAVRNRFRGWLGSGRDDEEEDPIQQAPDEGGRSPEMMLQTGRGMVVLEQALRELPPRQQQAFLLRVWEGLDVKQTAKAMACAEGSVKTHYSRAVHALREKLEGHWG